MTPNLLQADKRQRTKDILLGMGVNTQLQLPVIVKKPCPRDWMSVNDNLATDRTQHSMTLVVVFLKHFHSLIHDSKYVCSWLLGLQSDNKLIFMCVNEIIRNIYLLCKN